jgi:hypothetical protein
MLYCVERRDVFPKLSVLVLQIKYLVLMKRNLEPSIPGEAGKL